MWSPSLISIVSMSLVADASKRVFNCEKMDAFIASIVVIHPFEGVSRSTFYSCVVDHVAFFVKVSLHTDLGRGPSQVDTEIEIIRLLTEQITRRKRSPCLLEMVKHKTCKVSGVRMSADNCLALCGGLKALTSITDSVNVTFCRYKDMVKAGLARDRVTFMVLDKCNFTLEEYLRRYQDTPVGYAIFASLLWMIIHFMCVVRECFPDFWHADLHLRNVMLSVDAGYRHAPAEPKWLVMAFAGTKYCVPYVGLIPKVIDFGHSEIPSRGVHSPGNDAAFKFRRSQNDLLFLFHVIHAVAGHHRDISALLAALDPTMSYVGFYAPKIDVGKVPTYREMLENPVFDYRVKGEGPHARYVYDEFC